MQSLNQRKRSASSRMGLQSFSKALKDKRIVYTVGSRLKYAPYVEFGTGGTVNVPAGYEDFAIQFKGKGIRKINLKPRPYLIPAFESEIPILRKNIQNVIKNVKS